MKYAVLLSLWCASLFAQVQSPAGDSVSVQPVIVQKQSAVSSGSVASLVATFANNTQPANSVIEVCAVGNTSAVTSSDTQSLSYQVAARSTGTSILVSVLYALPSLGASEAVTCTNGGSTASMAMEIYEVQGLIQPAAANPTLILDQTVTAAASVGVAAVSIYSSGWNDLALGGAALGTAAQTITVTAPYHNDSGQLNPSTPAGLFSFVSMSSLLASPGLSLAATTETAEPWSMAMATFKTLTFGPGPGNACAGNLWKYLPINVTSNTQIFSGIGGQNFYLCKMFLAPVAAAANVNIVESSTSGNACATSPIGMLGGATAALGADLAINSGFVMPAEKVAWARTATPGDAVCIFTSAQVTGVLAYVVF